jgi:hypothetical protein
MRTSPAPAQVYETVCFGCRAKIEVPIFRGGGSYNFGTYRGPKTGAFYRVDRDRIFRGKIDLQAELQKASSESEGGVALELVPDGMSCPRCGEPIGLSEVTLSSMPPPAESFVEAVLL